MKLFAVRKPTHLLRALSALLTYPDAELRAALPEIREAVRATRAVDAKHREGVVVLVDQIAASDPLDAEARYVALFDRGRRTCLNLFEHAFRDGRERGPAMLELRQRYVDAGMEPVSRELPDHLPLLLEYLSCCDKAEIRNTIGEVSSILREIGNTLLHRRSRYASVLAALLAVAGERGLDRHAPPPPPEDLDREWEEKPAFAKPEHTPAQAAETSVR